MTFMETAELLGNIGEFFEAIAVVVTLGYLAFQIKHNTNSARSQSRQTLIDGWSMANWEPANDCELLRIYATAIMRWPDLPNAEKARFDIGMGRYLANLQNGILLKNAGMLDGTITQSAGSGYRNVSSLDGHGRRSSLGSSLLAARYP